MTGEKSMFLTLTMKEGGNVKFGGNQSDKIIGKGTIEQDESVANIQVPEDTSEPDQTPESEESPEAEATPEAQDGSKQANQSKNTFKYKSSHPEDQIIGNKDHILD